MAPKPTGVALYLGVTADGVSDKFNLPGLNSVFAGSVVTGIGGSTPTFQLFVDLADAAGNWQQVAALTAQTATGTQTGLVQPLSNTLTPVGRFRWSASAASGSPTVNVAMTCVGA